MEKRNLALKEEEEFTPYLFEGVEENANPGDFFSEAADASFNLAHQGASENSNKKLNRLFSAKELFDRLGYGFAAHQFITILFFLSGAGPFLVGLVYGFRSALSSILASITRAYARVKTFHPHHIAWSGVIFGFSLLGFILALRLQSPLIFSLSLIVSSVGVVTYGELYNTLVQERIKHERKNRFLKKITHYGLVITAISFIFSGWLFDQLGLYGSSWELFGMLIPVAGYFISFELAAVFFFISGYFIRLVPLKKLTETMRLKTFIHSYWHSFREQTKLFFTNKYLLLLYVGAFLVATVEVLGATYYGYIVYDLFKNVHFGAFLNVAIIFSIAIFSSLLGPVFTKFLHRKTGLAPMFVFGVLLLGIFPLTLLVNHHFFAVAAAASCAVLGSSILGVAQGLLARKLLSPSLRRSFFQSIELMLSIPFITLVPIGALLVHLFGFTALYYSVVILLLGVTLPLYFLLVLLSNRKRL